MELALAGAFQGKRCDYYLTPSPELTRLVDKGLVDHHSNSLYFLTKLAMFHIKPAAGLKQLSPAHKFLRDVPTDQLSMIELMTSLVSRGWTDEYCAKRKRLTPYVVGGDLVWYRDAKGVSKQYLQVLLNSAHFLESGLRGVYHFQMEACFGCTSTPLRN